MGVYLIVSSEAWVYLFSCLFYWEDWPRKKNIGKGDLQDVKRGTPTEGVHS
jgi:hypothetical protein